MLTKEQAKARVLSQVLKLLSRHGWNDTDDFSIRLVDKIIPNILESNIRFADVWSASKVKTSFFQANHVSRMLFVSNFIKELSPYLKEIGTNTTPEVLSFEDLLGFAPNLSPSQAEKIVHLLDIRERVIQDELRNALREAGAMRISQRKNDSSLEIADIEDFTIEKGSRLLHLTVVVKGYRSVPGKTVTFEDVSHQIMKAFNGTFPDFILLILAKPAADALVTNMVRYGESVGNKNLVIVVDPVQLAQFLRTRKMI